MVKISPAAIRQEVYDRTEQFRSDRKGKTAAELEESYRKLWEANSAAMKTLAVMCTDSPKFQREILNHIGMHMKTALALYCSALKEKKA
ncbi:MAG TPA: hypothetical protein VLE89_06975 [Chlamydiales bacterium]|nr:hypothetical protein [Chlamydiales bacterium]